ncbi:hypothetical protein ACWDG9_23510 [Streptomyces sp. NPDC001073]
MATVPSGSVPAAFRVVRRAVATSPTTSTESSGAENASASSRSDGPKLSRSPARRCPPNPAGGRPKPITSNSSPGESRWEGSANSSIVSASSRRWIEVSANGRASVMNPGRLVDVVCGNDLGDTVADPAQLACVKA